MRQHLPTVLTGLVIFLAGIALATKRLAPEYAAPIFESMMAVLGFALLAEAVAHRYTRRAIGQSSKPFEDNPLAMIVTRTRNHEIVAVNSAYEKLLGWSRKDSVGNAAVELRVYSVHTRNDLTRLSQQDEAKASAFRMALRPPTTTSLPELVAADGTGPITVS